MRFVFEVQALTRNRHLDGTIHYVIAGQMTLVIPGMDDQTLGQISMPVPQKMWESLEPSDTLEFPYVEVDV